jgi:outer membrane autotransporter protein
MVTYGQPGTPGLGLTIGIPPASGGLESGGIQADTRGTGDAIVNASGNVTGFSRVGSFYGLLAHSGDTESTPGGTFAGNAAVSYHSGTINLDANGPRGILVWSQGDGSATVTTDPGTKIIIGSPNGGGPGIYVFAGSATAANGRMLTANVASEIMNFGPDTTDSSSRPYGIRAVSTADAPISVNYAGPGITTQGSNGVGIGASSGSGSIDVNLSGPITTGGSGALGILANSLGGPIAVQMSGQGTITTQGPESHGIQASSTTGTVQVTATNVSTTGEFSTAINATSAGSRSVAAASIPPGGVTPSNVDSTGVLPVITGLRAAGGGTTAAPTGNVTVNIAAGGSIMGGWQATPFSLSNPGAPGTIGPLYGLPAAGVILSSAGGTATLTNDGSIGALSDLAIVGDPQVTNNGTITGFVQFTGGDNSIINNGTFNLRYFADTDGGGGRDTVRVAVADLGTGPNNSFTNNGTLALPQVTGATTLDLTGQYLPLSNPNNTMALGGPLHGQLIGVATFTNSGTIDLQANPVPGDVLMITGGRGGSTPGTSGGGTFISNGGTLKLDTVLNEGGTATHSDTLVVDGTSVGTLGATKTDIRNAGGKGALTVGDGILVVQVLDPNRSATGAFTLAHPVDVGLVEYRLFHGGVDNSNPGDWFLRSDFTVPPIPPNTPTTPTTPPSDLLPTDPPPDPLPPGNYPIIGPRVATYGVVQPIARELGLAMLGTLHERIGDTLTVENADPYAEGRGQSGWARFFGEQVNKRYQAFVEPTATGRELGVQAGFDLWRGSLIPGHRDAAGVYFAYGNGVVDVNGLVTNPAATGYVFSNTGHLNLEAYSGGAYWTHYGPGGWYLDAVLQGTAYTGNATTAVSKLPTDGSGFIGSLEGGYPIPLPLGPRFILEPQGQIIYQHVRFHDAFDNLLTIGLGTTSGATGRLGVRGQWTINTEQGQVWQPYVRANVRHNWGAEAALTSPASDLTVPLLENTTWLEFAAGATVKINASLSFYAQAGYEFAVAPSNARYNGVKGDIGLRWTFGQPPPPSTPAEAPAPAAARSYLVFFDWDKATLTDRARQIIGNAADNSTRVQYTRIEVNGYTDTSGTPRYNQGLSIRRAQAVQAELIKDGVSANAITIQGFGETHLLVPTGQGVREPQNRRVEIIIR